MTKASMSDIKGNEGRHKIPKTHSCEYSIQKQQGRSDISQLVF